MRDLRYIIIFLIITIFSGLGVSYYKEGLDCAENQYNSNGLCCLKHQYNNNGNCVEKKQQPQNKIYAIIFLVLLIVWLVIIKRET
jgi:hypothetical protein